MADILPVNPSFQLGKYLIKCVEVIEGEAVGMMLCVLKYVLQGNYRSMYDSYEN